MYRALVPALLGAAVLSACSHETKTAAAPDIAPYVSTREADRIVVVKSAPDTPYPAWIGVSRAIESAGGILTLELESERTIQIK